ncbi:hypothetical protein OI25_7178 [Paraburkholderia fungorum]|jgi:hypothetical protein|uniref:Uncharacterized protein n=1 Tax=Paraburkholderia fungorum TaxID=134537 RepID=A0AAU8T5W8_9BURK|nr:hypothetical protein OI25_7178 [Paraburkholderia fungorum]PRZ49115.1 hypothetical protein BX589_12623 [Paraburkholderia fungorum]
MPSRTLLIIAIPAVQWEELYLKLHAETLCLEPHLLTRYNVPYIRSQLKH